MILHYLVHPNTDSRKLQNWVKWRILMFFMASKLITDFKIDNHIFMCWIHLNQIFNVRWFGQFKNALLKHTHAWLTVHRHEVFYILWNVCIAMPNKYHKNGLDMFCSTSFISSGTKTNYLYALELNKCKIYSNKPYIVCNP